MTPPESFSLVLFLVILDMPSEVPLMRVIFRTQVALEARTIYAAPFHVVQVGPMVQKLFAAGFALSILTLRGWNV